MGGDRHHAFVAALDPEAAVISSKHASVHELIAIHRRVENGARLVITREVARLHAEGEAQNGEVVMAGDELSAGTRRASGVDTVECIESGLLRVSRPRTRLAPVGSPTVTSLRSLARPLHCIDISRAPANGGWQYEAAGDVPGVLR